LPGRGVSPAVNNVPEYSAPPGSPHVTLPPSREWGGEPLASDGVVALIVLGSKSTSASSYPVPLIAAACGDGTSCLVRVEQFAAFLIAHREGKLVCHDAGALHGMLEVQLRKGGNAEAIRCLWEFSRSGRLLDVELLDQLLDMAEFGIDKTPATLAEIAETRCRFQIPGAEISQSGGRKAATSHPGQPTEQDRVALQLVESLMRIYRQMRPLADRFVEDYTGDPGEEVGPLSLGIQVRGAIALDRITRLGGLRVESIHEIIDTCDAVFLESSRKLHEDSTARKCFKWDGDRIKTDPRGFPIAYDDRLVSWLEEQLGKIRSFNNVPFAPPRTAREKTARSSNLWGDWTPYDLSLDAWERLETASLARKVMTEAGGTRDRMVRPGYQVLPRIRSEKPNLASLRRIRGGPIFSAPPGRSLVVVELSDLELRCLADAPDDPRETDASLARLFREDLDPVRHVAAALHGREEMLAEQEYQGAFDALKDHRKDHFDAWMTLARSVLRLTARGFSDEWIDKKIREELGGETNLILNFDFLKPRTALLDLIFPGLNWMGVDSTKWLVNSAFSIDVQKSFVAFSPRTQSQKFEQRLREALAGRKADADLLDRLRQLSDDEQMKKRLTHGSRELYERIFLQPGETGIGRVRGMVEADHRRAVNHLDRADDIRKEVLYELAFRGYEVAAVAGDEIVLLLHAARGGESAWIEKVRRELETLIQGVLENYLVHVPARCKVTEGTSW
jgi:hypothetical protein